MYQKIILLTLALLLGIVWPTRHANAALPKPKKSISVKLAPEIFQGKGAYRSTPAILVMQPWAVRQWQQLELPNNWGDSELHIELWDDSGHRLKELPTRLPATSIDLSAFDPTHYPSLRLVVKQGSSNVSWPITEVYFTYTEVFNYRLLVLIILVTCIFLGLTFGAIHWRLTLTGIWLQTRLILHFPATTADAPTLVTLGWIIVAWSAVVAIPLGSFSNPIQMLYLFVKLPFLFLCTFCIAVSANVVMAKLLGIAAGLRQLAASAVQTLALTAIVLAALSPILWWLRLTNQGHDVALLWSLGLFGLSFMVGIWRLWQQYRHFGSSWPLLPVMLWAVVYGLVLLQLGWLLRPWVGTIDPISKTVPFSRLYSGNVFQEIFSTINRLIT